MLFLQLLEKSRNSQFHLHNKSSSNLESLYSFLQIHSQQEDLIGRKGD